MPLFDGKAATMTGGEARQTSPPISSTRLTRRFRRIPLNKLRASRAIAFVLRKYFQPRIFREIRGNERTKKPFAL